MGLGYFLEIEAIDNTGLMGREKLLKQCESFLKQFNVDDEDLLEGSYSDMLMELNNEEIKLKGYQLELDSIEAYFEKYDFIYFVFLRQLGCIFFAEI